MLESFERLIQSAFSNSTITCWNAEMNLFVFKYMDKQYTIKRCYYYYFDYLLYSAIHKQTTPLYEYFYSHNNAIIKNIPFFDHKETFENVLIIP
jgi:hypothetical protein